MTNEVDQNRTFFLKFKYWKRVFHLEFQRLKF